MTRAALLLALFAPPLAAQELEPRALVNAPVGTNFLVVATGYLFGNVLLDPAVPIEDGQADLWTVAAGYLRTFALFGQTARISLAAPFATGTWKATFAGNDTSATRTGFGDPIIKLAWNFIGSPALPLGEFVRYRQTTVAGVSLAVTVPLGQYYPDRLVNLGTNRWSFSPRFGLSTVRGNWVLEGYLGAIFFTRNNDFFGGQVLTQDPLIDAQAHVIRQLGRPGLWMAGSAGYAWGGTSTLNGVEKDPLENIRLSLVLRVPAGRAHAIKVAYINGLSTRLGSDFDTVQLVWQYAFGGRR